MGTGFQSARPGHPWVVRFVVLLLLAAAFGGWWWLMRRTLENEREALRAGLERGQRERLERAVRAVAAGLDRDRDEVLARLGDAVDPGEVSRLIRSGRVGAVLHPEPEFVEVTGDATVDPVVWGSDASGRDSVVSALLDRLGEAGVAEALRKRLLGEEGPPMKASFRHRAIERFIAVEPDSGLEKVGAAEAWRAAAVLPEEGLRHEAGELVLWWSEEDVLGRFEAAGVPVVLGEEGVRVASWKAALRVRSVPLEELASKSAFAGSAGMVRWIGLGSGLLFALAVGASLWTGWRDRRVARMRTDLAASVAHELRTPLAGQRVLLESLLGGLKQTPEEQREYLEGALRSNRRLGSLAEQFLTFSRLERGVLRIERSAVRVREVIDEVFEGRAGDFEERQIAVEQELVVRVDRDALGSIAGNLVENAWKYGGDRRWVRVSAERVAEGLKLEVEDRGRGLDAVQRRRVFDRFWRAERGLDRKVDGLGLGLTIVKSLAEAHGGRVEVESEAGKGSLFRVYLKEEDA